MSALAPGTNAPDFSLAPAPGPDRVTLSGLRGEPVVLFFVPLAFSSTCTTEFCHLRDEWSEWGSIGARILGISIDSPFVVRRWREELAAPFPILSDFNKDAAGAYDVLYDDFHGMRGVAKRSVFVVDRDGVVRWSWVEEDAGVLPPFDEIREAVRALSD